MNAVKSQVEQLVRVELAAANEKYPPFHSTHEGYAVILEEVEEAEIELGRAKDHLGYAWGRIKNDTAAEKMLAVVKKSAECLACEAIQVAAMVQKYLDMEAHHEQTD